MYEGLIINVIYDANLVLPLIAFITGNMYIKYVYIVSICFVSLIVSLARNRVIAIRGLSPWIGLAIVIALVNCLRYGEVTPLFVLVYLYCQMVFSILLSRSKSFNSKIASKILMAIWYAALFLKAYNFGISPVAINGYFPFNSRNAVAEICLILQVFYSYSYFRGRRRLPIISMLGTVVACFFCYGRSGILLSTLMLIISIFYNIAHMQMRFSSFVLVLIGILTIGLVYRNFGRIVDFMVNYTNFSQMIDTERYELYKSYIGSLKSTESVLFGSRLSEISNIHRLNDNPHNSYIFGHSYLGLAYIAIICQLIRRMFERSKTFLERTMIGIILIKCFFDTSGLPGYFDFVLFYILFSDEATGFVENRSIPVYMCGMRQIFARGTHNLPEDLTCC